MLTNLRTHLLLFAGLLLSTIVMAQPANDECANAIAVGTVTDFAFSSIDATTGLPYHPTDCTGGTADSLYNDIWYLYTADFTGMAEFSTCGSADFDTNIAAYAAGAACPPDASDLLACNEDAGGCAGFTSKIIFDVVSGESYLLRIGGWGSSSPGEEGSGTFTISEFIPSGAPENDDCANAIAISSVTDFGFTTVEATTDGPHHPDDCVGGTSDSLFNDVWYLYTADFTGTAEFTTCGTANFDTNLAAYSPSAQCPPTADDLISCSEDGAGCDGYTSKTTFDVEEGMTYLLRIGGWGSGPPGEEGTGTFTIGEFVPVDGPENDECENAIVLTLDSNDSTYVEFNTANATTSDPFHETGPAGCLEAGEPVPYNDIWYSWTATFTGYASYDNCGTANFDTKIAVYGPDQSCPPSVDALVACGDDGCAGFTSFVEFPVEEGKTYLLRMGAWSASGTGIGTFILKRVPPPVIPDNDVCMNFDTAWVTAIEDAMILTPFLRASLITVVRLMVWHHQVAWMAMNIQMYGINSTLVTTLLLLCVFPE